MSRQPIRTNYFPGRCDQTELSSDQIIVELTHVLGALELHGLEKALSAFLSGQWSVTCLFMGHFGLGRQLSLSVFNRC